jgi:hypothetical protein
LSKITSIISVNHKYCRVTIFLKTSRFAFNIIYDESIDISNENITDIILKLYNLSSMYKPKKTLVFSYHCDNIDKIKELIARIPQVNLKKLDDLDILNISTTYLCNLLQKKSFVFFDSNREEYAIVSNKRYKNSTNKLPADTKDIYTINDNQSNTVTNSIDLNINEAYYLNKLLCKNGGVFPSNYNMSIRNLEDRFLINKKIAINNSILTKRLFDALSDHFKLNTNHKRVLSSTQKLIVILNELSIKGAQRDSFIKSNLKFGFTNDEVCFVIYLLDNDLDKIDFCIYKFILYFVLAINKYNENIKIDIKFDGKNINLTNHKNINLTNIKIPDDIRVIL